MHELDLVRAIQFIIERKPEGANNISSPQPLSHADFAKDFQRAWGDSEIVLKSRHVVPRRPLEAGSSPSFPSGVRWRGIWSLLYERLQTPAQKATNAAFDRLNQEVEAYGRETRSWIQRTGYDQIPSYRGKMALILDRPLEGGRSGSRVRSWTTVEWKSGNRFFASRLGRMVWTGGYTAIAVAEVEGADPTGARRHTLAPRRIERPGKAFSQMHLGREGWYIKFPPVRSQEVWVHLPTLVRNLNQVGTAQRSSDIGDGFKVPVPAGSPELWEVMQGHPSPGPAKRSAARCRPPKPTGPRCASHGTLPRG